MPRAISGMARAKRALVIVKGRVGLEIAAGPEMRGVPHVVDVVRMV